MKLTCTQENLNFGLQTTGHLANKNVNLPILNNVLLEAKEGILKLSSTNLEIGISGFVRCKVDKEGSFTVDARLLSDYVNLLNNDQVKIELKPDDFLQISCGNSETKIKGLIADDFPVIPKIEKEKPYGVKTADFKNALSQVLFAVSTSETRPEIGGVLICFNKQKNKLTIVGTDSYRLAEKIINLDKNQDEKDVIVPVKTLHELLRILNNLSGQSSESEELNIYLSDNQILFTCGNIELISRLIEGQYPDYKQIIPKNFKTKVVASSSELAKIIKTVALFSKSGIFDINLLFEPAQGIVAKSANTQIGESTSVLEVEYEGEINETVLNHRYLLDAINNIGAQEVEISLIDNNIPCILRPKGDDSYLHIIMPIKQ
ncbi:MAG: DNA polymerase III subunit beta [Parcubacteria group bacterium]